MSSSDVSAKRVTADGSLAVGPARIRQVQVLTSNVGAGRLTLTNGDGGPTLLDLDFIALILGYVFRMMYGLRLKPISPP